MLLQVLPPSITQLQGEFRFTQRYLILGDSRELAGKSCGGAAFCEGGKALDRYVGSNDRKCVAGYGCDTGVSFSREHNGRYLTVSYTYTIYGFRTPPQWWVKTRRASSGHCRNARVYGHTTTAMHCREYPPPRARRAPPTFALSCFLYVQFFFTPGRPPVDGKALRRATGLHVLFLISRFFFSWTLSFQF